MTTTTAPVPLSETNTPMLLLFCIGESEKDGTGGPTAKTLQELCLTIYKRDISLEAITEALDILKHRELVLVTDDKNYWGLTIRGQGVYEKKKEFRKR